jgi:hypothetical protein
MMKMYMTLSQQTLDFKEIFHNTPYDKNCNAATFIGS